MKWRIFPLLIGRKAGISEYFFKFYILSYTTLVFKLFQFFLKNLGSIHHPYCYTPENPDWQMKQKNTFNVGWNAFLFSSTLLLLLWKKYWFQFNKKKFHSLKKNDDKRILAPIMRRALLLLINQFIMDSS